MPSVKSPSTRREWIEIVHLVQQLFWICCLPPHGGSGLKSNYGEEDDEYDEESPSTRREWIEILMLKCMVVDMRVSLHTEGVD